MRIVVASVVALLVSSFSATALAAPPAPKSSATAAKKKKKKQRPMETFAAAPEAEPVKAIASAPAPEPAPIAPAPVGPAPASKETAIDAPLASAPKPISVAPLLGYATNHLNLGLGMRAGYTFPQRIYVGGTFVYHLGTSDEASFDGRKIEASTRLFYPGAEVGYDIPVGPVVLRPYGGVGLLVASVSRTSAGAEASDTSTSLGLWPGLAASYDIPKLSAYVGADTRLLIATNGGDPSFGLFASGGIRF